MKIHRDIIVGFVLASISTVLFFYQTFLFGRIPFPGDLLAAEYKPWSAYSLEGYNPGAIPNKAQYFDTLRQLYPWKSLARDELRKGNIPLWNPYNFSGSPLLANLQTGALYPLSLITLPFSNELAWTILVILQPFLAVWFTYVYTRKIRLSEPGSLITSMAYGFSTFMAVWLEYNTIGHVISWLPLLLFLSHSIQVEKSRRSIGFFIATVFTASLAGHPQVFFGMMTFVLIYAWVRLGRITFQSLSAYSLLGIGIAAMQWVPGIELIIHAARSNHTYETFIHSILIKPQELLMAIIPDIFGSPVTRTYWMGDTYIGRIMGIGIIPFILSIYGLFYASVRKQVRFFLITIVFILTITTDNPITRIFYIFPIPILSSSNPTLFLFIISFALSVLSGYGLDTILSEKTANNLKRISISFGLFVVVCLIIFVLIPRLSHSEFLDQLKLGTSAVLKTSILYASFVVCAYSFLRYKKYSRYIFLTIILLSFSELWLYFNKFNPFVHRAFVYPEVPITHVIKQHSPYGRVWGVGSAAIEANFGTALRIYSPDGYDPLYPKWYGQFIQSSLNGHIAVSFTDQTRSDARITASFGKDDFASNPYRTKILQSISVRTILDRKENGSDEHTFPPDTYVLATKDQDWIIYTNTKSSPRAGMYTSYRTYTTDADFETKFFNTADQSPLLSQILPVSLDEHTATGTANIVSYEPTNIHIKTTSNGNQLLVLTDTYYPGWTATVDSVKAPIYKTNYAFRSVVVPPGNHLIHFSYRPLSFRIGSILSCISLAISAVICMYAKKEK